VKLPSGAEAQPYLDEDAGIVYKLFDFTGIPQAGKHG
jgi:hypothetical protein